MVVLGAGLVGSECGIYLDGLGKEVTLVEMNADWAPDAYFMHKNSMATYVRNSKMKIHTSTRALEITDKGLVCESPDGTLTLEADTILLAAGMKPNRSVAEQYYNTAPRVYETGDCIKAGRVVDAVQGGYYRALDV